MPRRLSRDRSSGRPLLAVLALLLLAGLGFVLFAALRLGPAPAITIEADRPAIGAENHVAARFSEPSTGLGTVRLELVQGDSSVVLGERTFAQRSPWSLLGKAGTTEAAIEATVGRRTQDFLKDGTVTLRATATRLAGPLRGAAVVAVEKQMPVRLRPPRLELNSQQHYVRQGGSGMVAFRVGEGAVRSGVRAGAVESPSFPRPGGGPGERFCLYALPWEDPAPEVRLFAEDDAGNRAELPFVTIFKPMARRSDAIELTDEFLARVVPAIAANTPGFDATGPLLDQYLVINREVRRANLARIAELAATSEPQFLWSGPFEQMSNTQRFASFAERRTYLLDGRQVDEQTHLGLDLASNAQSVVPAANSGKAVFADFLGIYGNAVVLDHGYGLMSLYGHLSSISVEPGQVVTKGQPIGTSGATGLAGGDHLHLEIFLHGKSVDPIEWLDAKWIRDNLATKAPVPGV